MTKAQIITEKLNVTLDRLVDAIESETVADDLKRYYKQAARFTQYSLNNQMLILMQKPDATRVAGYSVWQTAFKRQVRKGEHGASILAPHTYKVTNDQGKPEKKLGFHATSVFDISQTEGEPLENPIRVDGDDGAELCDAMVKYGETLNMTVTYDDLGSTNGICKETEIVLNENIGMTNRVSVLAHELAHKLAGHRGSDLPQDMREWQAETAAYIFCERYGIANKAPQYLKNWGATRANIKASLKEISKASSELINGVEAAIASTME
jgi:hypothetical protein